MEKMKMPAFTDQQKLFKNEMAVKARLKQLQEPHVKPLSAYVEALRSKFGSRKIPYFDPWDGGINSECLFLLEAPGGNAVKSNFISRNNNDESAKNFFELNREAGLLRERTISWNIVPWYIGTENEKKIRAATVKDIEEGIPHFVRLLKLLPKLRAVVLLGRKAEKAATYFPQIKPGIKFFYSPHPSPLFVNNHPDNRNIILHKLLEVSRYLNCRSNTD